MANCSFNDCLKAPIPARCFDFCIYEILARASPDQKRNVLHISAPTADKIYNAFRNFSISNFNDLSKQLDSNQISEVIGIFKSISQQQLDYFR